MAIVKMKKFTLLTFESKKPKFLKEVQGLSNVEFINLQDEGFLEKYEDLKKLSFYTLKILPPINSLAIEFLGISSVLTPIK